MDFVGYINSLGLTPSDWPLVLSAIPALWFVLVYGGFTKWFTDPLGWVVLVYALSVCGLLTLIVYAIFTGQRIDEGVRLVLGYGLLVGLVGKVLFLHIERRKGRLEKRRLAARHTGSIPTKENS